MVSKFSFGTFLPLPRHECRGISGKRTGKTAHFLRGGDRLAVVETSKNTSRPAYLILRSGTAAAVNYGEARGAESRADFIHKLKIVFKELNETTIWLEVIAESSLLSPETLSRLSRKTANFVALSRPLSRLPGRP